MKIDSRDPKKLKELIEEKKKPIEPPKPHKKQIKTKIEKSIIENNQNWITYWLTIIGIAIFLSYTNILKLNNVLKNKNTQKQRYKTNYKEINTQRKNRILITQKKPIARKKTKEIYIPNRKNWQYIETSKKSCWYHNTNNRKICINK